MSQISADLEASMIDLGDVVPYVCNVISGEENLSNGLVKMTKQAIPKRDETALSDSSQSL